jgi:hypothetical protein
MGIGVRDAETAALNEPEDAVKGAIVDFSLEPADGSVKLLGRWRHRTGRSANEVLHVNSSRSRGYLLAVSHSAAINQGGDSALIRRHACHGPWPEAGGASRAGAGGEVTGERDAPSHTGPPRGWTFPHFDGRADYRVLACPLKRGKSSLLAANNFGSMARAELALRSAYIAFNSGDVESAVNLMHPEVDWPNAWEGGRILGRVAIRNYWKRQFAVISSKVEPRGQGVSSSDRCEAGQ